MLTPGPLRSTAAHAEEQLAVVTISAAARLQRRVQATGCPLESIPPQVTQKKGTLGTDTLLLLCVVVVVCCCCVLWCVVVCCCGVLLWCVVVVAAAVVVVVSDAC